MRRVLLAILYALAFVAGLCLAAFTCGCKNDSLKANPKQPDPDVKSAPKCPGGN